MSAPSGQAQRGRRQEVGQVQSRKHQPGLHHLGLEGQTHPQPRHHQPTQAPRGEGLRRGVGRKHEQQDEQRVRDVPAVEQDGDRGDRQGQRGGQTSRRPGDPAHGAVEDEHGQGALDHLGQDERPDVKAEEAYRERLDPERARQLVDGDGAPGVEGPVEEVVPVLRHAARGSAVKGLERVAVHPPRVGQRGEGGDDQECRPRPARLIRRRSPELPAALSSRGGRTGVQRQRPPDEQRAGGRVGARRRAPGRHPLPP